jgi:hypothetical protein
MHFCASETVPRKLTGKLWHIYSSMVIEARHSHARSPEPIHHAADEYLGKLERIFGPDFRTYGGGLRDVRRAVHVRYCMPVNRPPEVSQVGLPEPWQPAGRYVNGIARTEADRVPAGREPSLRWGDRGASALHCRNPEDYGRDLDTARVTTATILVSAS